MKPLSECRLYAFVDTAYLDGRDPVAVAEALCEGGADLVQLRAKDRTAEEIRQLASRLLPVTRAAGVGLVINDHPEVALSVGAELCHLGQEDFFDRGYRHVSELCSGQRGLRVGLSSHAPEQAERAVRAGADYVAVGPVYATGTKPGVKPVTLAYVRWAARHLNVPWFAIGGINLTNLEEVLAAGARRICVVSAILRAPDVRLACRAFRERLDRLVGAP
ncbi:MAG: thiamine phosphate synthase [Verrucomicrobiota bacterium]|nr:thiamine phosphate synthase [Limisphaera sp.]MDW8381803.1 thiamine phosphate synthase [Verrucomicrobiota bacterium]